jgi:hypothetical protein
MTLGRSGVGGDDFCHRTISSQYPVSRTQRDTNPRDPELEYLLLTAVQFGFKSFQVWDHNLATVHPDEFFCLEAA